MKISALAAPRVIATAAAFFMLTSLHAGSLPASKIGLQLYSLRNQFQKDVPGTLDEVKAFGFRNVELAGTYNLTPEQFKQQLDARGLWRSADILPTNAIATTWKAWRMTRKFSD